MGLAKGAAKVLLKEASLRPFKGRVLTLGKQNIYFAYKPLQKWSEKFKVALNTTSQHTLSNMAELAAAGYISDQCFFKSLGFSESKALDISDFEGADYVFDLNSAAIPEYLVDAFDVIIDGGTIEHVFHVPNALHNICKMLRKGGRIIHISPSSNHIDHGFYMFSPGLFWDFYKANDFEINNFQIFRYTPEHSTAPWEISNYQRDSLNRVSFGGLDGGMYGIICIVTKTKKSTVDRVPQQGGVEQSLKSAATLKILGTHTLKAKSFRFIKRYPVLYHSLRLPIRFIRLLSKIFKRKGLGLKVVDRY